MADDTGDLPVDYSSDHKHVDGVVDGTWRKEADRDTDANDKTIKLKSVSVTEEIASLLNIGIGLSPKERVFVVWSGGLNGGIPSERDFLKKGSTWYAIKQITTRVAGVQWLIHATETRGSIT